MFVEMVREWGAARKFVIGERSERAKARCTARVQHLLALIRRFAFPDFPTLGYDFCLLDRQVVDEINRINEKNSSIFVLIYWLGYRPVAPADRARLRASEGHVAMGLWRKIGFTVDTLIGFTYLPARA